MGVEHDARFAAPLLTVADAGRHLQVAPSTLADWRRRELLHAVEAEVRGAPTLPLASVAEAQVLRGLRASGLSGAEIDRVTRALRSELGEYALITERLAHDGASIFRDVARRVDRPEWARVRDGQHALPRIIDDHLQYLAWAEDGFPLRLRLRSYARSDADVVLDPRFGGGQPVFARTKVRPRDVMREFMAGERPENVVEDYGLALDEVYAAIRVLSGHRDAA